MAERRSSGRGRSTSARGSSKGSDASDDQQGELQSGTGWKTALIDGATFFNRAVQYSEIDGLAIFEGDIVLGTTEEVERQTEIKRQLASGQIQASVVVTGADKRWPNCVIPYDIDPNLPDQNRVTDAIAHWEANTNYQFVLRTAANAAQFPDWVTYTSGSGCSSSVGRQGGQQFVNLGSGCTTGNAIHETGHVVGLWHEQSRADRDSFVTIHWDKIQAGMEHNFDQHITDGDDVGAYDYGSIMHYPRNAFSVDGSDTITPTNPPTAQIGQRTGLSAGDIAGANSICSRLPTIKEVPKDPIRDTFKEIRKDPISDPTFKEVPKDPIRDTFKEVHKDPINDPTFKEVPKDPIRDTIKEVQKDPIRDTTKEIVGDPKGPLDPPGGTLAEQPGPVGGIGPVVNPGTPVAGQVPFAVATGHQAPALGAGADPTAELAAQLEQIAAALQQSEADQAALVEQYEQLAAALAALQSGGLA
jgi:astacin (peptidase family M12A)